MPLPLYMDINRPEGLAQQIVTLIQFVERYFPGDTVEIYKIIKDIIPKDIWDFMVVNANIPLVAFTPDLWVSMLDYPA